MSSSPAICTTLSPADFCNCLHPRKLHSHKGDHGSAGLIGGASGMAGALLLAARSALLLGSGRVFASFMDTNAPSLDNNTPELMLRPIDNLFDAPLTALAIGPGLGVSSLAAQWLAHGIATDLPLVLDADALNLLSSHPVFVQQLKRRKAATVITPHPAEAARLLGDTVASIQNNRLAACSALLKQTGATVILKGPNSLIGYLADDQRIHVSSNPTGNPGLAAGGMGDVLTGIVCALLAQGHAAHQAATCAVYIHGLAADELVEKRIGPIGLTASEVATQSRTVLNRLTHTPSPKQLDSGGV